MKREEIKWEEIYTAKEFADFFVGNTVIAGSDSCPNSPSYAVVHEFYWTLNSGETVGMTTAQDNDYYDGFTRAITQYWKLVKE